MILTCPKCDTQYFAEDSTIGDSGRNVTCAACGNSWFVRGDGLSAMDTAGTSGVAGAHEAYRKTVRDRRRRKSRTAALLSWLVSAVLFFSLGAAAIVFRNDVVRAWPQAASAYRMVGLSVNPFGFDFGIVEHSRTFEGTDPILTVTGEIENVTSGFKNSPDVRVALLDEFGREIATMRARATPDKVASGKSAKFVAVLNNPPVESYKLDLKFLKAEPGALPPPTPKSALDGIE